MKKMLKKLIILSGVLFSSNQVAIALGPINSLTTKPEATLSLTSCLGYCIKPFFNTPVKGLLSASALLGTLYGAFNCVNKYYARNKEFNNIEQWLSQSAVVLNGKNLDKFSYSGYLTVKFPKASDLLREKLIVRRTLGHDICSQRILSKTFNNQTINNELSNLESRLKYLAQFTPLPILLQKKINEMFKLNIDDLTTHDFLITSCNALISVSFEANEDNTLLILEQLIEETNNKLNSNKNLGKYIFRSPNFDNNYELEYNNLSKNPYNWTICNAQKASQLYFKVLRRYMRLLTLEKIINPLPLES